MDISLNWGGDLQVGSTGDLAIVTTPGQVTPPSAIPNETLQRVLRRLFTNPQSNTNPIGDYLWDQSYVAGLPAMVGSTVNAAQITAIIRTQMLQEDAVAAYPVPTVTVTSQAPGYTFASVTYT